MSRSIFVRCAPLVAALVLLASAAGAATSGLLPVRPGDSTLYRYDVNGPHPSLGQVWVVRSDANRISVTVSPNDDAPGSFGFEVGTNGQVRSSGNESPVEPSAVAAEMARNFASAVNLLATVAASAPPQSFSLDVPAPGEGSAIRLNARSAADGTQRNVVADGVGLITLPGGAPDKRGRVPAPLTGDVTMHIEAHVQSGALAGASGVVKIVTREKQPKTSQYTWTLSPNG